MLLVLNLLVKPFYILGIDAEIQRRVGEQHYGLFFALLNLTYLFNIVADAGITNFNNRNIAMHSQLIRKHFAKLFVMRIGLATLYFLITLVAGYVLGYSDEAVLMLVWLTIAQVFVSFIMFMRSNLTGLHLFWQDSIISVLDRVLLIISCGYLLWVRTDLKFQIQWLVYLQVAAYAVTFVVALVLVLRHSGQLRLKMDWPFSVVILRKSLPFASYILLSFFYTRLDSVMLDRIRPDGALQAGIYAQGYRFFEAANMFAYLFTVLLLPMYSRALKERDNISALTTTAARVLLTGAITLGIIGAYFSFDILHWRYGSLMPGSARSFGFLMISFIAVSGSYIFGTLLTANGSLKAMNLISLAGLVVNLTLNFIFIPRFGAPGAAGATLATQLVVVLAYVIYSRRETPLRFSDRLWKLLPVYIGLVLLAVWFTQYLPGKWLVHLIIAGSVSLFLSFVLGIFRLKALREILSNKQ